jgi:KRAB domain-containing zinc finger protein
MYDESAPLHAQRGNRIEGDFMLDALQADGKRRRRRTAEDSLTVEEIAEYMGSDGRSTADDGTPTSYQIACRYCGEVSTDLSRYFAHTLSLHGAYVCHQCGKSFTTKSSLLRHRPIHTGMRRFACSICRKEFYRKDKCKAHIKRHLGIAEGSSAGASVASALGGSIQLSSDSVEPPTYHVDSVNVAMQKGPSADGSSSDVTLPTLKFCNDTTSPSNVIPNEPPQFVNS